MLQWDELIQVLSQHLAVLKTSPLPCRVVLLPLATVHQKDTMNAGRCWEGTGLAADGSTLGQCRTAAQWEQGSSRRVQSSSTR